MKKIFFVLFLVIFQIASYVYVYAESDTQVINIEVTIDPYMMIEVNNNLPSLSFYINDFVRDNLIEKQISIAIYSNMYEPYEIVLNSIGLLLNNKVYTQTHSFLQYRVENGHNGGHSMKPSFQKFSDTEELIFQSNDNGVSDEFSLVMLIEDPQGVPAGNYYTDVQLETRMR